MIYDILNTQLKEQQILVIKSSKKKINISGSDEITGQELIFISKLL
jgi:hypothetical protein